MNVASSDPGSSHSAAPRTAKSLSGARILVVEDEFLLALQLEELLQSRGCTVLGPFKSLEDAMAASREPFDLAILDINLKGTMVYPLADDLLARGRPFLFLSGYTLSNLPERFRSAVRLGKPCEPETLIKAVQSLL
jgi:DNA-binding response OmpR family regulator